MAGAGFKDFVAGEVLTASDVDTYLMQQSVMVFAGTAERAAALGTPSTGMVTFVAASTAVQVWDGSDWSDISGTSNVADDVIQPNYNTISNNYTFVDGYNGVSAGPITIASGATVTVGTASAWSIV